MTILILLTKRKADFFSEGKYCMILLSFLPCIWKEFQSFWHVNCRRNITQNAARPNGAEYSKKYHKDGPFLAIPHIVSYEILSSLQLPIGNKILHFILMFRSSRWSSQKISISFGITYSKYRGTSSLWTLSCLDFREATLIVKAERLWNVHRKSQNFDRKTERLFPKFSCVQLRHSCW